MGILTLESPLGDPLAFFSFLIAELTWTRSEQGHTDAESFPLLNSSVVVVSYGILQPLFSRKQIPIKSSLSQRQLGSLLCSC